MTRQRYRQLTIGPLITIAFCVVSGDAFGQAFFRPTARSGRFIEAPRSVQQQLREAERSLAEGEESDAVVRLGDLLQRDPQAFGDSDLAGQDFFLEIERADVSQRLVSDSLLHRARRMLGELSPSAIETYELRYGPMARKLFQEAGATRDWRAVEMVRRKYFHTKAGYDASYILAQRELLGGHALAASLLLDDVVALPRAVEHLGDAALQMHAAARKIAGRDAAELKPSDSSKVDAYATVDEFKPSQSNDYAMFGGGPARNGNTAGQMPLTNVRWELPTTSSPRQERALQTVASELATSGKLPPPSWTPLRVGDQLLMRTTEMLVGVDYETGKRVWTYPWFSSSAEKEKAVFDTLDGDGGPGDLLSQRVWNDLPYGQVTSDGERVYMIDDLAEVEAASFNSIGLGGTRPADNRTNTLIALELETEGKLRWRIGAGADDPSDLSNAFFLGPPLPLDGRLYVMVELAGDVNLCCLDPVTGSELWRQQLVAVESGSVDRDPIRRVAGATPTYQEGLLICSTGAGAVVAIDLSDRMLRWGLSFDRNTEMVRSISGRGTVEATQLMQRWYSGTAIAIDDTLLVTPIESDRLFGLDLLTGKRRFAEKSRVHMRYLAGARDGKFFVVGSKQMRAYDLESGRSVWTSPGDLVTAGQQISGVGVFGDGDYLLPTTSNQLIRVSLDNGTVLDRRNTRYALGNLLAVDGNVVVQGITSLSVAYGEATLEPIVNKMLDRDPDDFEALVRKSELLIQHGQRREALEMLARARAMDPANDEVHLLSVAAMLGELREDLDADSELVDTLDKLIERPAERAELLALRVRGALGHDEYEQATDQLVALSRLLTDNQTLARGAADQVIGDPTRHCGLDSWLAARVSEVVAGSSPAQLAEVNKRINKSIEPQLQGSASLLSRVVRHFGADDGVTAARAELADRFARAAEPLRLERLSLGLQVPNVNGLRALSDERLLTLTEAYASRGLSDDASAALDVLETRGSSEITANVEQLREMASRTKVEPQWSKYVALDWQAAQMRTRGFTVPGQRVAATKVIGGQQFRHWRLVSEGSTPLAIRDENGMLKPVPLENYDRQRIDGDKEAQVSGSFMVILMSTKLLGVDLYNVLSGEGDVVVWERNLSGDGSPIAKRRIETTKFEDQIVRYYITSSTASNGLPEFRLGPTLGDRLILLQGGDLMAWDLETSETLWRTSSAPRSGAVLAHDGRVAVVSQMSKQIEFFSVLDGRPLESKPWEFGSVWATAGPNVLCYTSDPDTDRMHNIRLINVFTGEVVLERQSLESNRTGANVPCSYGRVVAGRYLVLLDSSGQATLWDLVEAKEIGRPKLPAYEDLQGLQTVLLDGQVVLLPKRRVERARLPQTEQLQTADGRNHATVHAAFALSLDDGTLRWGKEFKSPWGCTIHQPAETPILIFTRSKSVFNSTTAARRKQLDAVAIDVRDGRELNRTLGKQTLSTNNSLETRVLVQEGLSRVVTQVGNDVLTYRFVDEKPPAVEEETDTDTAEDEDEQE